MGQRTVGIAGRLAGGQARRYYDAPADDVGNDGRMDEQVEGEHQKREEKHEKWQHTARWKQTIRAGW